MKRFLSIIFVLLFAFVSVSAQSERTRQCNPEKGCQQQIKTPEQTQTPVAGTETTGGISADPNEIIGPVGYDSVRWVSINDVLNYTILFENDPEFATANAQKVDVRFKFEEKAQMRGFGLGMYGFANMSWPIEDSPAAYQNRLDLRDSMHIYVDLVAGLDVVKQEAFWTFNSIDPETGWNPWQVDRGMLPVNDSTHIGEGFLKFQLKPNSNMQTGDTISFAANIVFDQNDTIPTNRWCVTIDAGMPTSKVRGKVDSKNENLYHITLQASDDKGGSGLKRVVLYQANNFGIYEEFAICPLDTVIDFIAEPGKQYSFFSLAEDNTGNVEPLKEKADLVININAAPTGISLSDTIFRDDILAQGFIAEISSEDADGTTFTYELAEGEGAVHNDLFLIKGSQLLAKNSFKCSEVDKYKIRISSTDDGGMTFSKAFTLTLAHVLEKPQPDTLAVTICEGDSYEFKGEYYEKSGTYYHTIGNDYMCDSLYVLQLTVLPRLAAPMVTVEGDYTLVSSVAKGNRWFTIDGTPVEGATGQKFTPTAEGVYYVCASNGSCLSEPSNAFQIKFSTDIDLSMNFAKGWNWLSSNLSDEKWSKPMDFLAPIADNVEKLVGSSSDAYDAPDYGIVGNITKIEAANAYKLKVNDAVGNVWAGSAHIPAQQPIILKNGWNWIGYTPVGENTLEKALSNIVPAEKDVIKTLTDFAIYEGGKWVGTLTKMRPGEGYLYYSSKETQFTYPSCSAFFVSEYYPARARSAMEYSMPWSVETNNYPDNMNIIADVYADNIIVPEGLYTIGAFIGEHCVGMGKYVNGKLFLTVNGSEKLAPSISFKAYNNTTNKEYSVAETLTFENILHGNMSRPYKLTISEASGVENISASEYNVYPKPLRNRMYINGAVENIKSVTMVSMNGVKVLNTTSYTVDGIDVSFVSPGTYVLVLSTTNGTFIDKVVKVY